VELN
jgi:hypothetical protein